MSDFDVWRRAERLTISMLEPIKHQPLITADGIMHYQTISPEEWYFSFEYYVSGSLEEGIIIVVFVEGRNKL